VLLRGQDGEIVRLPADSVWWVERSLGRFDERRAALFAAGAVGMLAVSAASALLHELSSEGTVVVRSDDVVPILIASAGVGVAGAAIGGAGTRAAVGGGFGAGVGAMVGAALALSAYESPSCGPDDWLCIDFGPGFHAVAGAVAGGFIGFVAGSALGALAPGERWGAPVALDLRPDSSGGIALSARVRF
jgi:hypothetical protein